MRLARSCLVLATMLAPAARTWASGDGAATASASASISIKADVNARAQAQASAGDAAYVAGKFEAALAAYGEGFAQTRDTAFVYAMAQSHKRLGHKDDAEVMFKMYLAASGTLKYKASAEGELGAGAKGAGSAVGGLLGKVKDTTVNTVKVVGEVGAGVYGVAKISIAGSISASAKASAKAGDEAYAAGKFSEAATSYGEAYAQSQQAAALYAGAQANAQAGHAIEARGQLVGYLAAQSSGTYAKDARSLLLAMGGRAELASRVTVGARVSATVKAQASLGDQAMAAGKFLDASKAYGEAFAKQADAALLYAKGMAQFYAGATTDAAASLKAYLAASGKLEFKASAEATLHASGGGS